MDFRSDTLTKPCAKMIQAMSVAEVGDDVYREDPSVQQLEAMVADMAGFEAALFTTSGTQANILALLTHCERGQEFLTFEQAHVYYYECGGAAALGGLHPRLYPLDEHFCPDLDKIQQKIRPDDVHFPTTQLLCMENTHNGSHYSLEYLKKFQAFRDQHQQIKTHLDGARLWNAAIATQSSINELAAGFDSVNLCLSKGLGAPGGSVLCGSRPFIEKARKYRKMLGGGMRQVGYLAAACQFAIEHNFERLAEDHANAAYLFNGLSEIDEIQLIDYPNRTSMVFFELTGDNRDQTMANLVQHLADQGITIAGQYGARLVTHKDVSLADCQKLVAEMKHFFRQ